MLNDDESSGPDSRGRSVHTLALGRDRTLHVISAGEGLDIVLLHGAMTTHRDWLDGPFDALARLGRVVVVDRPGHGLSRRPRFAGDPRLQAAQLREGLHRLGVVRPILVGHSFGCLCALAYAEQFPRDVARLVLVAPLAFPELRLFEHSVLTPRALPLLGPLLAQLTPESVDRAMLEMIHRIMFSPDRPGVAWQRHYPWPQILDTASMVANAEDSAAVHPLNPAGLLDYPSIRTSASILSGNADRVIANGWQARRLAAALPDADLILLDGVGHMLHHSRPDAVVEAVRVALAR